MVSTGDESPRQRPIPPTDWGSIGVSVPEVGGTYNVPAVTNGDADRRAFLVEVLVSLYSERYKEMQRRDEETGALKVPRHTVP